MSRFRLLSLLALLAPLALVGCDSAVEGPDATSGVVALDEAAAASSVVPTPRGPDPISCSGRYNITWIDNNGYLAQYGLSVSGNLAVTSSGGVQYAPNRFTKWIDVGTTGAGTATICTVITGFAGSSSNCTTVDVLDACM